jgi:multiple sugar transport system ATP-binding protein
MAAITYDNVSKSFAGGVQVLRDLDLTVEDGEFLALVGPSGSGKSTALRIAAGLETVSSGRLLIGDEDVTYATPKERDIAMVFQTYALYPHMEVADNLSFALKLRHVPASERSSRVTAAAAMLRLGDLLRRKPAELSGGQRQRVAMGRAIVREPKAFLMDEPLSNLDAKLRVSMRASLSDLHRRLGVTTIYVTHDQIEAITLGTRVAVLRDGILQQCAAPRQLYKRPANVFVASFIGSPAMNLVRARVTRDGGPVLVFGDMRLPMASGQLEEWPQLAARIDKDVILGIRPASFSLGGEAPGPDLPEVKGLVTVTEDLGSEMNVVFEVDCPPLAVSDTGRVLADEDDEYAMSSAGGRSLWTARVDPSREPGVGNRISFASRANEWYFFDPDSGEAIAYPSPAGGRRSVAATG